MKAGQVRLTEDNPLWEELFNTQQEYLARFVLLLDRGYTQAEASEDSLYRLLCRHEDFLTRLATIEQRALDMDSSCQQA